MVDSFLGQAEEGNKTALLKLQLIGHYIMGGDFSITDLSHEMNLSVPTVTKLVSELIEEGFVHDFGKQGTAGGRRPNIYGLNPYAGYFVGVDIKKDIITLAIINFKGQVVDMRDCVPFVMENSVQALDRLCDVVNGFIAKSKIDRAKIFRPASTSRGGSIPRRGTVTAISSSRRSRSRCCWRNAWAARSMSRTIPGR